MPNSATIYVAIKNEVVSRIAALNLQSDDGSWGVSDHVYSQLSQDLLNTEHPCVVVTTEKETVEEWGGTTESFYFWYPVAVFLIDTESSRQHNREADYQEWLRAIRAEFNNKRMTGTMDVARCLVKRGANFQPKLSQFQFLAGSMTLRFFVTEDRNDPF